MKLKHLPGLFAIGGYCAVLISPAGAAPVAVKSPATAVKAPAAAGKSLTAVEQAEIIVPKEPLGGPAALEVRFPSPMIGSGQVGQEVEIAGVLDIKPALAGTFRWQSTRSGTLQTEGVLPLGTAWRISLKKGLKSAGGAGVEAPAVTALGADFVVRETTPKWFSPASETTRQPEIALYFNDAVNAAAVARMGYFANREGLRVEATASTPNVAELGKNPPVTGTWEEQAVENRALALEAPAVSVVKVK